MRNLHNVSSMPALKTLGFFQQLETEKRAVKFEMKHVWETSKSMAHLNSVN